MKWNYIDQKGLKMATWLNKPFALRIFKKNISLFSIHTINLRWFAYQGFEKNICVNEGL